MPVERVKRVIKAKSGSVRERRRRKSGGDMMRASDRLRRLRRGLRMVGKADWCVGIWLLLTLGGDELVETASDGGPSEWKRVIGAGRCEHRGGGDCSSWKSGRCDEWRVGRFGGGGR